MSTIPIAGWGGIELFPQCIDNFPTFTIEAGPYMDLVDAVYSRMTVFDRSAGRIPKALFRYYCAIMWWCRVLWLKKSNARILSTSEEDLLDLSSLEMSLPSAIAQYLANVGIFKHGDEQFYFDFQSTGFFRNLSSLAI